MRKRTIYLGICALLIFGSQIACAFFMDQFSSGSAADQEEPKPEFSGDCAPPSPEISTSQYIAGVTMAKAVEAETMAPQDETSVYGYSDVFHAVVETTDAPAGTLFRAAWYVIDVGDAAVCNDFIDEHDVTTGGSRYLDFNLTPNEAWPEGTYRVEISVDGVLSSVQYFTVR